jgi:hypothetical protein
MLTLIGTLSGVIITAVFGLLTAHLTNRSQYRRAEQEHRFQIEREIRSARRETYARVIVAAQALFDCAMTLHQVNRANPVTVPEFLNSKPSEIEKADTAFEIRRVEAYLLAGVQVRAALDDYSTWLRAFWPEAASGTSVAALGDDDATHPYHRMIHAMQAELVSHERAERG